MSADPELRERLERAASSVDIDAAGPLERIHVAVTRRGRVQRTRALAVAAAIGLVAVILVWLLRLLDRGHITLTGGPTGRIAYLADRDGHRAAFDLDVESGAVVALSPENTSVLWAAWSPDRSRLASIEKRPGPRYAVVVSEGDGSRPVTIGEEDATGAVGPDLIDVSWSPDGSRIAYSGRTVEDGVARRTIIIVNADGSGAPMVLGGLWTSVSWSPDGADSWSRVSRTRGTRVSSTSTRSAPTVRTPCSSPTTRRGSTSLRGRPTEPGSCSPRARATSPRMST